jgi:hypothetical protein
LFYHASAHSVFFLLSAAFLVGTGLPAAQVPVRSPQGSAHGFVVAKTLEGKRIAVGDMTQTVHNDRVTSRLILRFADGSIDDETAVFSQRGVICLLSYHHIQRGPYFPKPIDFLMDAPLGKITNHIEGRDDTQVHLDLPKDLANGLPLKLLLNILPSTPETQLSFLAPGEKPRLVKLVIKPVGQVPFTVGGSPRKAVDYVLHIEIGGVAGLVAPIIGKQPADHHVWILDGIAPAFIREEGSLYEGGPVLRIEQVSPSF